MKTLTTSHCILEPLVAAHATEMFSVLGDPAIYEFENSPPISEEWLTERYQLLESRSSGDGTEQWLNWVIRLSGGKLAGCVQAGEEEEARYRDASDEIVMVKASSGAKSTA